jgi:hypothetical protein
LRRERKRSGHQQALNRSIKSLTDNLEAMRAESHAKSESERAEQARLNQELAQLKDQLHLVEQAKPLKPEEQKYLQTLTEIQNKVKVLDGENAVMKTTIWAFTALIAILLVTFMLSVASPGPGPYTGSAMDSSPISVDSTLQAHPSTLASTGVAPENTVQISIGESCDNPLEWRGAAGRIGEHVAVSGPIMRVTHREDVNGSPTWIEIGAAFPDSSRLTLIIWGSNRPHFTAVLRQLAEGREVCAQGVVETFRGQPQIELESASQLRT